MVSVLGVTAGAVVVSLLLGSRAVGPGALWELWEGGDTIGAAVVESRLMRTGLGLVCGCALGAAGAMLQGVTRNPLADPGLLGINAGAATAVVAGMTWWGLTSPSSYVWAALGGGVVAAAVILWVSTVAGGGPGTVILAGAAVTAALSSVTAGIAISSSTSLDAFRFWQVGSVAGREWSVLVGVLPVLILGAVVAALAAGPLNVLALGDDLAATLGQRVLLTRLTLVAGAVALAAAATAAAGPIGFVGLIVPHLARRLVSGTDHRLILPASAALGATLLLLADTLGRVIAPPTEVQVGVLTALVGAPALVLIVRRGLR